MTIMHRVMILSGLLSQQLLAPFFLQALPLGWQAMAGLRIYQNRFSDSRNFAARGRESSFSISVTPFSEFPLAIGAGYQFVNFSSADWQAPGQEVILRSPSLNLSMSLIRSGGLELYFHGRWLQGGGFFWAFEDQGPAPEKISLRGYHLSLGSAVMLSPLSSLLFEIARGIEYTFDSVTGEPVSLRPATLLAGFRVGLQEIR